MTTGTLVWWRSGTGTSSAPGPTIRQSTLKPVNAFTLSVQTSFSCSSSIHSIQFVNLYSEMLRFQYWQLKIQIQWFTSLFLESIDFVIFRAWPQFRYFPQSLQKFIHGVDTRLNGSRAPIFDDHFKIHHHLCLHRHCISRSISNLPSIYLRQDRPAIESLILLFGTARIYRILILNLTRNKIHHSSH